MPPFEEPPSVLQVIGEIVLAVLVVTAGIMLFGAVFAEIGVGLGKAMKFIVFAGAGLVSLTGWFTDALDPPRTLTSPKRRRPRRKRRTPKGAASRKRR